MKDSIVFLLLIQVILIALNAVFASAEIAVLSVNELKLRKMMEKGNKRARRLFNLIENPAKFLATIQIAITLSGFLGSAFAAENFSGSLAKWLVGKGVPIPYSTLETLSVIVITLILSYFTLIFGELVPKRVAMKKSEELSLALSGLISVISTLFTPVVWFLSVSTNAVLRLCGIDPDENPDEVSEEEIRMMVDAGSEKGAIDHEEKEWIQNVFDFDDLKVCELATRRTDTIFLCMEDDSEEWDTVIRNSRHTLYPIYEESPDHVIGILNAKDYFRLNDKSRANVMANAVKPVYFVPETIKADVLFRNMKQNHVSLAVVLDEYGGMTGIITHNDLIEQLVGELNDDEHENTTPDPHIEKIADNEWLIYGNVPLRDIEDETDVILECEQCDTFTGLVFDHLGMIPADGQQDLTLQINKILIHVTLIRQHQIERAVIQLIPEEQPEEN